MDSPGYEGNAGANAETIGNTKDVTKRPCPFKANRQGRCCSERNPFFEKTDRIVIDAMAFRPGKEKPSPAQHPKAFSDSLRKGLRYVPILYRPTWWNRKKAQ